MARKKVTAEPVLRDWAEVDEALGAIAQLQREQSDEQTELDGEIARLREAYKPDMTTREARILRMEKDVEEYTVAHQTELEATERKRSKRLTNGTVGFRRSRELATTSGLKWGDVVGIIQKAGKRLAHMVRVSVAVNKVAVADADLADRKLRALGMRWREKDAFGYDLITDQTAATVPAEPAARKEAG